MDEDDAVRRKLEQTIGSDYDSIASRGVAKWLRSRVGKWAAGAVFAVLAMALVVTIIESHRLPTPLQLQQQAGPKKPVTVRIIPPGAATPEKSSP